MHRALFLSACACALAACGVGANTVANGAAPGAVDSDSGAPSSSGDAGAPDAVSSSVADAAPPIVARGHYEDGTFTSGLFAYDYQLWVPGNYQAGQPAPLVVALHGCGQNKGDLAKISRFNDEADQRGFLVLYPQQSSMASPTGCWNTSQSINEERDSGELAAVMGMLTQARQQHAVDGARIYVMGLSAGAAMASNLAACYMDVFAAAAVVAGPMYKGATLGTDAAMIMTSGSVYDPKQRGRDAWACSKQKGAPVAVFDVQGTDDKMVAQANGAQVVQEFATADDLADDGVENGSVPHTPTSVTTEQVPGGYRYDVSKVESGGTVFAEGLLVQGMGHTWSGGDPNAGVMGTSIMGGDVKGPTITPMIGAFFAQHHH